MNQAFEDESIGSTNAMFCAIVDGNLELSMECSGLDIVTSVELGPSQVVNLIEYLIALSLNTPELPYRSQEEQDYCLQKLIDLGLL